MSKQKRPIDDIAPDDFLSTWGASSYEEAIKEAQDAPSITPESERPRCPECESKRVSKRNAHRTGQLQKDPDIDWKCTNCRHFFDDPVYLDVEEEEEEEAADDPDGLPEKFDRFEWVTEDDLAEPPVGRRLKQLDDRSLTALAIVLYSPWHHTDDDPSYRDLGTVFPYSRDWVGERVRAWKNGEFRDLVADPRPWGGR